MGFNNSANMNLPIPQVGNEAGPQYATDVNNCLTLVDQHNHTPGYGVQITPNGLNINTDLPINANNLTLVRSLRFSPQGAPIANVDDIGCLYEVVNDLYYNDGLGNQIRLTQSGGIAGTSGSIANLVAPASATYVTLTKTIVFQSNTNRAANLDAGFIILRTPNASSPGLTLQVPGSIASDYTLSLPLLPLSTLPMQLDSSGNMSTGLISQSQIDASFANALTTQIVYIKDVKPSGTQGGTFTQGSYLQRVLNTLENPSGYTWVSLSSNQFTLQAGTYDFLINAPCESVGAAKARLQNISDASTAILGASTQSGSGTSNNPYCIVEGRVTIASAKTFEVQHRCSQTSTGDGFGDACAFGDDEVYTMVRIQKVMP